MAHPKKVKIGKTHLFLVKNAKIGAEMPVFGLKISK